MRLALGKATYTKAGGGKAVVACVSATEETAGCEVAQAPGTASEFALDHRPKRRLDTEQEAEDCLPSSAKMGNPPPVSGATESAQPDRREAAIQALAMTPTSQPGNTAASDGVAARPKKKKAKTKVAKVPAGEAAGADQKGTPPAAEGGGVSAAGGEGSAPARPCKRKKMPCPVFGCSRKHALDNCSSFQDMTPKQRLDLAHQKQLCLFCLRHPMGMECWTLNKWPNCTIDGCDKSHHEMLHEVLKSGEPSAPAQATAQKVRPPKAAGEVPAPTTYLKRELLEGLGIDPDTLEVRIRIRGPGEQGKSPDNGGTAKAGAREAGGRRLSGKLLESFSLLCQAGERLVSYMGESRHQGTEAASPA